MTRKKDEMFSNERLHIVSEVGGLVNESRLTLGIHGQDLEPAEISAVLSATPTSSHRRGEARRVGLPSWSHGAWLFTVEGNPPVGPDELVQRLFLHLPSDPAVWKQLAAKYSIQVTFGIFVENWNRGFELSSTSLKLLTVFEVPVAFDIYADCDEEGDSDGHTSERDDK